MMTLQCQCGSVALVIEDATYRDESMTEQYRCEQCGATGSFSVGPADVSHTTGCVVSGDAR